MTETKTLMDFITGSERKFVSTVLDTRLTLYMGSEHLNDKLSEALLSTFYTSASSILTSFATTLNNNGFKCIVRNKEKNTIKIEVYTEYNVYGTIQSVYESVRTDLILDRLENVILGIMHKLATVLRYKLYE